MKRKPTKKPRIRDKNYYGMLSDWSDVYSRFGDPCPPVMPRYVFAYYDIDDYNGRALVIISNNGRTFRIAEGSHCSCFGLEGQWTDKTFYGLCAIRKMLKAEYGLWFEHRADIERWLKHIKPTPKVIPPEWVIQRRKAHDVCILSHGCRYPVYACPNCPYEPKVI